MKERFSDAPHDHDRPLADTASANGRCEAASSGPTILLIDDNPAIARAIGIALGIAGYRLDTADGPEEAWSRLARRRYDAILLDMNFGIGAVDGEEGLVCLRRILADDPRARVIVITAHSGIRVAVAAMQAGARDFVMKPWRNADLVAKLAAAVTPNAAPSIVPIPVTPGGTSVAMIGESAVMQDLRALIRRVGPTGASVVVIGPAGSGRMVAARAIHAASRNAADPVPTIDLRRDDRWDRVTGASGTVILRYADRLDDIAQGTLIDLLPPDLRCIAIVDTVGPLSPALRRRLATIEVAVPPLASRGEDAVLLARHFARVAADRFGKSATRLTAAAETVVRGATWTDEVRGLALAVERAVVLADDGVIDAVLLAPVPSPGPLVVQTAGVGGEPNFDLTDAERTMIEAALREHRHNVTHAAAALGLSRGALYRRMARHGL